MKTTKSTSKSSHHARRSKKRLYYWLSAVLMAILVVGCINLESSVFEEIPLSSLLRSILGIGNSTQTRIVVVGSNDTLLYSDDGSTYTSASLSGTSTMEFRAVVWTGSRFVSVGRDSALTDTSADRIYYSADGISWSQATITSSCCWGSTGTPHLYDIAYGNGTLVAVGISGGGPCAQYSTDDGLTWTKSTVVAGGSWLSVTWDGTNFVAAKEPLGIVTYKSANGATFALTTNSQPLLNKTVYTLGNLFYVSSTNRLLIAGNSFDAMLSCYTTDSGNTAWTCTSTAVAIFSNNGSSERPRAFASSGSRIVAVGDINSGAGNACRLDYSDDLTNLTWQSTAQAISGCTNIVFYGLAWDGNKFIAVGFGSGSGQIATSATGAPSDWSIQTSGTATLYDIAVGTLP